ncbi:MAG: glycosyltransferase family 2 protein [Clostridia bacterium]|nr:glycosyltransferase family 2 protein [Clostridia bacterium]
MKKVSVIIPAYNAEKTIERAIKSITGGYSFIEVIVVNDGSTDNTQSIVENMAKEDDRIVLINQDNGGVGVARSKGIKESTGDYIAFCDSDDWYENNFIEEHIKHLEEYSADISECRTHISNARDMGNNDKIIIKEGNSLVADYLNYNCISVALWDKVYKRFILDNEDIFNTLRYSEDLYMNYVACKYAKRIVKFNTTKYNWYNNTSSLSRGKFNPLKLDNDFQSWTRIIEDCKKNYPELEETARLSSELWICGTFRSMVSCGYHNRELEKKIATYIRQDGIKPLKAEKNKKNKAFLRVALFSFPMARFIWSTKNFLIRMAKKILRR